VYNQSDKNIANITLYFPKVLAPAETTELTHKKKLQKL